MYKGAMLFTHDFLIFLQYSVSPLQFGYTDILYIGSRTGDSATRMRSMSRQIVF